MIPRPSCESMTATPSGSVLVCARPARRRYASLIRPLRRAVWPRFRDWPTLGTRDAVRHRPPLRPSPAQPLETSARQRLGLTALADDEYEASTSRRLLGIARRRSLPPCVIIPPDQTAAPPSSCAARGELGLRGSRPVSSGSPERAPPAVDGLRAGSLTVQLLAIRVNVSVPTPRSGSLGRPPEGRAPGAFRATPSTPPGDRTRYAICAQRPLRRRRVYLEQPAAGTPVAAAVERRPSRSPSRSALVRSRPDGGLDSSRRNGHAPDDDDPPRAATGPTRSAGRHSPGPTQTRREALHGRRTMPERRRSGDTPSAAASAHLVTRALPIGQRLPSRQVGRRVCARRAAIAAQVGPEQSARERRPAPCPSASRDGPAVVEVDGDVLLALGDGSAPLPRAAGATSTPISEKVLTQTLRAMERDGLIGRRVHPEVPPRVEYALTPLGATLAGPLRALGPGRSRTASTSRRRATASTCAARDPALSPRAGQPRGGAS